SRAAGTAISRRPCATPSWASSSPSARGRSSCSRIPPSSTACSRATPTAPPRPRKRRSRPSTSGSACCAVGEPALLRTPRLLLSVPTSADADAVYEACQDPDIQHYTTVPSPYTREDAESFVRLAAEWWQAGSEHVWAVRAGDQFAGVIGLHRIKDG